MVVCYVYRSLTTANEDLKKAAKGDQEVQKAEKAAEKKKAEKKAEEERIEKAKVSTSESSEVLDETFINYVVKCP